MLWLVALAEPASFVAVTVTDTFLPTSELDSVSVCPVAPSDHKYANVIGVSPDHIPELADNVCPTCGLPPIVGTPVFDGATGCGAAWTGPTLALVA
jgi:hypothetical protein